MLKFVHAALGTRPASVRPASTAGLHEAPPFTRSEWQVARPPDGMGNPIVYDTRDWEC
jgi:hypothetical protein